MSSCFHFACQKLMKTTSICSLKIVFHFTLFLKIISKEQRSNNIKNIKNNFLFLKTENCF